LIFLTKVGVTGFERNLLFKNPVKKGVSELLIALSIHIPYIFESAVSGVTNNAYCGIILRKISMRRQKL
jgi:hypothetical protein